MHLPFLTLMEQFNVISEGSRASGKARVMRKVTQLCCQVACGSRVVFSAGCLERVGETAHCRAPGAWGRDWGKGVEEGKASFSRVLQKLVEMFSFYCLLKTG